VDPESDAPDFFYYYYVGCVSHSDAFFFPFKIELLFSTEISTNSKFDKMKFQSFFSPSEICRPSSQSKGDRGRAARPGNKKMDSGVQLY